MRFNVILADCPWSYSNEMSNKPGLGGMTYKTMTQGDLCQLPVKKIAEEDSLLFLWATGPKLQEALDVMVYWGFEYRTVAFVWVKTYSNGRPITGLGRWTRGSCEYVLMGKRGHPERAKPNILQVIEEAHLFAPRGKHSTKPEEVQDRIEKLLPVEYTKIELFARRQRPGWISLGNEISGRDITEDLRYWSNL